MKIVQVSVLFMLLFVGLSTIAQQTGSINGVITASGEPVEYAQVIIDSTRLGSLTNGQGKFTVANIPFGNYTLTASLIGYAEVKKEFFLNESQPEFTLDFNLTEQTMQLDGVVVTATKTPKRQTNSPVIVNVINSKTLESVQACNLSEGLKFQPGLRVETNCQTCNYTQLRMNGLAGGYSQILINGRPIFSPLTGLYGLEQ